jgi:hypothetical protein
VSTHSRRLFNESLHILRGAEISRVAYRVGIFRSVSVGISRYLPYRYRRKTRSVFSVSKNWREPLKKLAGAPFFPRRGGLGPLFVHFTLLLKKKRNSRGIIQKKSSRKILKRCSRQSFQYNNTDRKIPIPAVSDTGKYRYRKNDWYHRGMQL